LIVVNAGEFLSSGRVFNKKADKKRFYKSVVYKPKNEKRRNHTCYNCSMYGFFSFILLSLFINLDNTTNISKR
jgi:hypothetical protein